MPHNKIYKATTVGGLSGIDYDPANDDYYMDILGMYIDNIEGVTWGKDVPNGHRTLIFIADNNFEFFEKTQFLVFEVMS